MSDEEIAAQALEEFDRSTDGRTQHLDYYKIQSAAVVTTLREAGRLVLPSHTQYPDYNVIGIPLRWRPSEEGDVYDPTVD